MTKLFFTKVLQGTPYTFLSNKTFRTKNVSILVPDTLLYYLVLHIKFASSSRSSQLVDLFAYENPVSTSEDLKIKSVSSSLLVYQFHNLFSQNRAFLFTTSIGNDVSPSPKSVAELFATAAWLERETSEMCGVSFGSKKDLRNLLLQYGDASAPFQKNYPSIGVKEVFYDSLTDNIIQVPVSTQI